MQDKIKRIFFEELWSIYQWIFLFIPGRIGHYLRGYFLSIFFEKSGSKITIKENVEIYHPERLSIGHKSGIGRNNVLDCFGCISIGDNVRLGPGVMIATMNHAQIGSSLVQKKKVTKPVTIGNDTWVGNGVTILPGVTIGSRCIIAAGSVVTKNVGDDCSVGGIPAERLKNEK